MMSRWWGLALVLAFGLLVQTAEAQQFGMNYSPRALCVTDPYGTPFHSWYGSPIAYNSYFQMTSGGAYSPSYSGTTTGYFWGGIPSVASASTPEWVVQRTSVLPIGTYSPWTVYPGVYPTPWGPHIGMKPKRPNSLPTNQQDSLAAPARDPLIR